MPNLGEDVSRIGFNEILKKLEKLKIIQDRNEWYKLREVRNELAHEYTGDSDKNVVGLNLLYESVCTLLEITDSVLLYCGGVK